MAELAQTLAATLDPIVAKALEVVKAIPGVRWEAGLRASYMSDVVRESETKLAIAVAPGLPIPISGGIDQDWHRTTHTTSNLEVYFLFSGAEAPTVDGPALPVGEPGVPQD